MRFAQRTRWAAALELERCFCAIRTEIAIDCIGIKSGTVNQLSARSHPKSNEDPSAAGREIH
jgi:hypothetical protein